MDFNALKKQAKETLGKAPTTLPKTPAKAPAKVASPKGTMPVKSLACKEGEEGELNFLTGLFERTTKKGDTFWSAFDKETEIGYSLFKNKDGKFALKVSQGKDSILLAELVQTKKGHLYGRGVDEKHYMVFESKPKVAAE